MKIYAVSLAVGLFVGAIYGMLDVRSPPPPMIALIGLLGLLIGEQLVAPAKNQWARACCVFVAAPGQAAYVRVPA